MIKYIIIPVLLAGCTESVCVNGRIMNKFSGENYWRESIYTCVSDEDLHKASNSNNQK